jgi:hypothetical protein
MFSDRTSNINIQIILLWGICLLTHAFVDAFSIVLNKVSNAKCEATKLFASSILVYGGATHVLAKKFESGKK